MRKNNIVFFSSGITEKSGFMNRIIAGLTERGCRCSYWRNLFSSANDMDHIALLPILIKKIPSFDFAVLLCEGHDTTLIRRGDSTVQVNTMRDNVLFEIGLCSMGLGLAKTILVTDETVRIPDDLTGVNRELALKRIVCKSVGDPAETERIIGEIDDYVRENDGIVPQVVIGAASGLACGYVNNFIFRTLEHITDGIVADGETIPVDIEKVHFHVCLPDDYDETTATRAILLQKNYRRGSVPTARHRSADFRFEMRGDELHIIDYPTTICTSYDTAKKILNISADDRTDADAAHRFTAKELRLFESSVRSLLTPDFLDQVLSENSSSTREEDLERIRTNVLSVIQNRLTIERVDY